MCVCVCVGVCGGVCVCVQLYSFNFSLLFFIPKIVTLFNCIHGKPFCRKRYVFTPFCTSAWTFCKSTHTFCRSACSFLI